MHRTRNRKASCKRSRVSMHFVKLAQRVNSPLASAPLSVLKAQAMSLIWKYVQQGLVEAITAEVPEFAMFDEAPTNGGGCYFDVTTAAHAH